MLSVLPCGPSQPLLPCLSTTDPDSMSIHTICHNWNELGQILACLPDRTQVEIQPLVYVHSSKCLHMFRLNREELVNLVPMLDNRLPANKFSGKKMIICRLSFDEWGNATEEPIFTNPVPIPGGAARLLKRCLMLPRLGPQENPPCVLAIRLESDSVWVMRIVALTGEVRIDLMAGATKADTLRVPNSTIKGSWTDLTPISENYRGGIFMIEFI